MEGRAHPSDNAGVDSMAWDCPLRTARNRLEQDLSSSRHIPHLNGINANMIRRIIPKGYNPHVCIVGAGVSGNQLFLCSL